MTGTDLIKRERDRQVIEEGWSYEHDDEHIKGELAQAAACYAWPPMRPVFVKTAFPWDRQRYWKPELFGIGANDTEKREARIRVLVKAGALIAAEIDRLLRVAPKE